MDFEDTLQTVGSFGIYQKRLTVIACCCQILVAFHTLSGVYIAYTPEHWCQTPDVHPNTTCTAKQLKDLTVPVDESGVYESCVRYDHDYSTLTSVESCDSSVNESSLVTVPCDAWQYDRTHLTETIVTEFNLVCGRASLKHSVSGAYLGAHAAGMVLFGPLTDMLGRFKLFFFGNVCSFLIALTMVFSTNYYMYLIGRVALSIAFCAEGCSTFVLVMEYTGPKYRVYIGTLMGSMWAFAPLGYTLIAYLSKDWRYIQLWITLPQFFVIVAIYFYVYESPRWLVVKGRQKTAQAILTKVAKTNGKHWDSKTTVTVQNNKMENFLLIFMKPGLVYVSFVLYVMWYTCALVYYSITFGSPNLGTNPFLSFVLTGSLELPSKLILLSTIGYIGLKYPITGFYLVAGGFLIGITVSPEIYWLEIVLSMVAKGLIACCFTAIWIYTGEIYPTSIRSSSGAMTYVCASLGAMSGAYVWALADVWAPLPIMLNGCFAILSGVLILTLPNTKGIKLTQTLDEAEAFIRNNLFTICIPKKRKIEANVQHHSEENVKLNGTRESIV